MRSMARLRKMEPLSEPFLTGNNNQNNNDNNLDPASLNASSRCRGLVAGFIVQIMNVVGCTYSYYRWGQYENATWDAYEWTLRVIVWLISQVDLALYLTSMVTLRRTRLMSSSRRRPCGCRARSSSPDVIRLQRWISSRM